MLEIGHLIKFIYLFLYLFLSKEMSTLAEEALRTQVSKQKQTNTLLLRYIDEDFK